MFYKTVRFGLVDGETGEWAPGTHPGKNAQEYIHTYIHTIPLFCVSFGSSQCSIQNTRIFCHFLLGIITGVHQQRRCPLAEDVQSLCLSVARHHHHGNGCSVLCSALPHSTPTNPLLLLLFVSISALVMRATHSFPCAEVT